MLKILLADDQAILRRMMQELLMEEVDFASVVLANDGAQAIDLSREHHFNVVVLDIAMPGTNGIEALKTLQQEQPRLPVIMLSTHTAATFIQQCLKLGARGYVAKESASAELVKAVRAVVAGVTYLCAVAALSLETTSGRAGAVRAASHRQSSRTVLESGDKWMSNPEQVPLDGLAGELRAGEARRERAEDDRRVAEDIRESGEYLREMGEGDRQTQEAQRQQAEALRLAAEAMRVAAEDLREAAFLQKQTSAELLEAARELRAAQGPRRASTRSD